MRPRLVRALPLLVVVSGIAIQASYAAYLSDRLWFFGDDWDFLLQRRLTGDADLSLWTPHNEHWSTVPILLFRLLFGVFGIGTYLPYALMAIGAHVAIWSIMFVLLRRSGILAWPAAVAVWAGAFLGGGVGAENMLWDFQVGFLGSGVLGLLAIVFLRTERWSGVWAAWFALVLALASSGIGLVFVGWACLDVLLRRGIAKALITGAVPGMAYVVWFALVGHKADTDHIKDVTAFPLLLVEGLDGVWSLGLAMPGAGFLVLAALMWVVFLRAHGLEAFALAASGLGTLLVAFTLFAYSRSGLGEGAGSSSRYLYFGVLFCAPALALGVELVSQKLVDRPLSRPVAMGVVLALTGALGLAHLNRFADHRAVNRIGDLDGRLAATTRLIDANAPLLGDYPAPDYNPNVTVGLMKSAGVLDDLRDIPVSGDQLLDAKGQLQVALGRETPAGLPAVRNVLWVGLDPTPGEPEPLDKCMTRFVTGEDAVLQFSVPKRGASIWVETEDNDEIETSLLDDDDESESIRWPVESDDVVSVESTAAGTDLQVRLPHGEVTVCPTGESG